MPNAVLTAAASGQQELTGLVGFVADVIRAIGAVGVGLLVAIENLFPPIPSEVVLPFAGFLAGRGQGNVWIMILAATIGAVGGAVILYELGRQVGLERTRRWLCKLPLVEADEVDRSIEWFERHDQTAVFTGRFVPLVRSLVSLPAGAEGMGRVRFLVLTTLGSAIWNTIWVWAGFLLGERWQTAGQYSDWMNYGLIAAVVIIVGRYVWKRRHRIGSGDGSDDDGDRGVAGTRVDQSSD